MLASMVCRLLMLSIKVFFLVSVFYWAATAAAVSSKAGWSAFSDANMRQWKFSLERSREVARNTLVLPKMRTHDAHVVFKSTKTNLDLACIDSELSQQLISATNSHSSCLPVIIPHLLNMALVTYSDSESECEIVKPEEDEGPASSPPLSTDSWILGLLSELVLSSVEESHRRLREDHREIKQEPITDSEDEADTEEEGRDSFHSLQLLAEFF